MQGPALQETGGRFQDIPVPGGFEVEGDRIRQPEEIVREACAYPTASWRMPPMLHISLHKLIHGIFQAVFYPGVHAGPFNCIGSLILGGMDNLLDSVKMSQLPAADQLFVLNLIE